MIDAHFWPTPNGWKITIMLEECGFDYKVIPVDIGGGDQFRTEFLRISPNNRMPAIVDHDPLGGGEPLAIFESGAILEYLAEKAGKFLPTDPRGKYRTLQWVHWQMANFGTHDGQRQPLQELRPELGRRPEAAGIRRQAVRRRGRPAVCGHGRPVVRQRIPGRARIHHRRHHQLPVGVPRRAHARRGHVGIVPPTSSAGSIRCMHDRRWKPGDAWDGTSANANSPKRRRRPDGSSCSTRPPNPTRSSGPPGKPRHRLRPDRADTSHRPGDVRRAQRDATSHRSTRRVVGRPGPPSHRSGCPDGTDMFSLRQTR